MVLSVNILRISSKPIFVCAMAAVLGLTQLTSSAAAGKQAELRTGVQTVVTQQPDNLPISQVIQSSSRSIPFQFDAVIGHRYQLVVSRSRTLLGGVTKLFQPTKSSSVTLYVPVSATGTWFTAIQNVAPTVEAITEVRKVVVKVKSAKAPTLRIVQGQQTPGKVRLVVGNYPKSQKFDYRLQQDAKNSQPYVWTAQNGDSLVVPRGKWLVAVRHSGTDTRDASAWSPNQPVAVTGQKSLAQPAPPRHGGRDPQGNPKIILSKKAGTSYWILRGGRLLYPIDASAVSAKQSLPVELPCEVVAPARVLAVNSSGQYSQVSNLITLKGAPCDKITALSPPQNFQLEDASHTSVTLSFNPVERDGENLLLERDGLAVGAIPSRQNSITLDGLPDSATYKWELYRRSAQGFVSPRPASLIAATTPPAQAAGAVRAFMLATDMVSISDARKNYMALDWVYPTYFDIDRATSGLGVISGEPQPNVDTWFRKRGVKVLPRILGSDLPTLEAMWATAELRQNFADQVGQIVSDGTYDGIQLDFEPLFPKAGIASSGHSETPALRAAHYAELQTDVVRRIHELLAPLGKKVSFAIPVNWCSGSRSTLTWRFNYCSDITNKSVVTRPRMQLYDVPGILKYSDDVFVMAWGIHWGTSEPGASAELDWMRASVVWLQNVIARQRNLDPDSVRAEVTLGRNLYSSVYYYSLVRTDTARPPAAFPKGPLCPKTQAAARARLRQPEKGQLRVDWVCPELRADKIEYTDAMTVAKTAVNPRGTYQVDDGETLIRLPDKDGFEAELWLADVRSEIDFIDIARSAGWKLGVWRLGREDQRMWDLPEVEQSK